MFLLHRILLLLKPTHMALSYPKLSPAEHEKISTCCHVIRSHPIPLNCIFKFNECISPLFQVKYLGKQKGTGLWGIKHTRKPVDLMVRIKFHKPTMEKWTHRNWNYSSFRCLLPKSPLAKFFPSAIWQLPKTHWSSKPYQIKLPEVVTSGHIASTQSHMECRI